MLNILHKCAISDNPFGLLVSMCIVVVLPAPFDPKKPKISPWLIENEMLSTATMSSYRFVKL
jgi:hypothetical protein